jgi:hypothetical protein
MRRRFSSISQFPAECGHRARYDKQHRPLHGSSGADEDDNWLRRFLQSVLTRVREVRPDPLLTRVGALAIQLIHYVQDVIADL